MAMDSFTATMLCEGSFELAGYAEDDITEDLMLEAWQYLVDTGLAWSLQGSFGRAAERLIECGAINAGPSA